MPKKYKKKRKTFSKATMRKLGKDRQVAAAAMRERMRKTIQQGSKETKTTPFNVKVHEPILSEQQRKKKRDDALGAGNTQMAKDFERYENLLNELEQTKKLVQFNKGQAAKRTKPEGKEAAQKTILKLNEKLDRINGELENLKKKLVN